MANFKRGNLVIGVSHLPGRKRPSITVEDENGSWVLGQFNSDTDAEFFVTSLEKLLHGYIRDVQEVVMKQ